MSRRKFRALSIGFLVMCLLIAGPIVARALPITSINKASPNLESIPTSSMPTAASEGDQVADAVAKLKNQNDAADPKLVRELSGLKTREAVEGLIEVYDVMHTIFMRREIVRALIDFDGVPDAEQPALQKMMDIATSSEEPELRTAALDALGDCKAHGKDSLMMIIRSNADDSVREKAMQLHVAFGDKNDYDFYKELYKPKGDEKAVKSKFAKHDINQKKKDKEKKPEDDGAPKKPRNLESLRLMAFGALISFLPPEELIEATKDDSADIRAAALLGLEGRALKQALEVATASFEKSQPRDTEHMDKRVNELPNVRVVAAQIIGRLEGPKAAPELMKRALNPDTPAELRLGLAEILAGFNDPTVNKEISDKLVKGHTNEKVLGLWAARFMKDDKLAKLIVKLLGDKDLNIVMKACETLAVRKDMEAVPDLQKLVEKSKDRSAVRSALDALVALRGNDPAWIDDLVKLTKSEDPELRTLALTALGHTTDKSHIDKLAEALNDSNWSTRLAALEALDRMHTREVIGPIIERLPKEDGRLQHAFIDTLWRLTGQPFDDNAEAWSNWWKKVGEKFQPLSADQVKKLEISEAEWRLKQTTHVESRSFENPDAAKKKPKFFGMRIISHHVLFIIDVSGSMAENVQGQPVGKGEATKIDIAKGELVKCLQGLEPTAFFNILTFSDDTHRWFEGRLAAADPKNVEEAKAHVSKLTPGGGTNTYDAIKEAFKDPDVDTIFIMSDGEPSVGVSDPVIIRDHVKQWNEHRDITINTIAVGGKFQILEWLADDSGGTHIKYE